jgi:hypothetical protein
MAKNIRPALGAGGIRRGDVVVMRETLDYANGECGRVDMKLSLTRRSRVWIVISVATAGILAALVLPPLKQPEGYHRFADDRLFFGVPNCLNVVSNAGFLIVGLMGLRFLWSRSAIDAASRVNDFPERAPYVIFFIGVLLTCFGSGYYHWQPNDNTLVWDRLPMTIAFMSLLSAAIAERIDLKLGLGLLWPLVSAGIGSVWWWRWRGNLWPYAAAQYFSIVLIGLLMILFPPRYTRSIDLLLVTGLYVLAKVAEALDARIFTWARFISGHTLKHLIAAFAVYWIFRMLIKRSRVTVSSQGK